MWRRLVFLVLILIGLAIVVTCFQTVALNFYNPKQTALMRFRAREAEAKGETLRLRQTWIELGVMPQMLKAAIIAAEDEKFYQHNGFDWEALQKAYKKNEQSGRVRRGGSTITQQLAKNLFLSPRRSYVRKFREAYITLQLELFLSKDRILELYLNCIEFGPGVFGVEEAARYHYRRPLRSLSVEEYCRLAAIIPSPLRYKVTGSFVSRRARVLQRIIAGEPPPQIEETVPDSSDTTGSEVL